MLLPSLVKAVAASIGLAALVAAAPLRQASAKPEVTFGDVLSDFFGRTILPKKKYNPLSGLRGRGGGRWRTT
ncbi:hypothetical protein CDD83_7559 [Cordyceps sp. RAO-2017]|nr:hypothetical protein CDD83_7559 [Cordyceps sp. RAO-2017]